MSEFRKSLLSLKLGKCSEKPNKIRNKRRGGIVKIVDNNGINDIIKEKDQIDINLFSRYKLWYDIIKI